VELALDDLAVRWGQGCVLLGLLFGGLYLASRPGRRDPVLEVAWALGLTMLVAGLVLYFVGGFTMGLGVTTGLVVFLFLIAVGSGLGLGLWSARAGSALPPAALSAEQALEASTTGSRIALNLGLFVGGLLVAIPILFLAANVASRFRGPVAGLSEMATPVYARDQWPINAIAGLAVMLAGWGLALVSRVRLPWGFGLGVICGTTVLGIVLTFWR
jgi:hypothetical protein